MPIILGYVLNILNSYSLRITLFVTTLYYNMIVPYLIIDYYVQNVWRNLRC